MGGKNKRDGPEESFREEVVCEGELGEESPGAAKKKEEREPEEMWLMKQEEWIRRASEAEEEIKVLIAQENQLRVCCFVRSFSLE